MRRACRPSPAWLCWALVVCAGATASPARAADPPCASPGFADNVSTIFPGLPAGHTPWAVEVGDFYGDGTTLDGTLDVVVVRQGPTDDVRLYKGNGGGALAFVGDYLLGASARDVVSADFDQNGWLDLAVAKQNGEVRIFEGTPSGFVYKNDQPAGAAASRLAVADFNLDGRPDLAVVVSGGVRILLALANFSFAVGSDRSLTGATAAVAGDFNEDGAPDLAVTQGSFNQVAVYLGKGDGYIGTPGWTPSPVQTVGVGLNPVDIAAALVDGDGHLDLVTANSTAGTLTVLQGSGGGGFGVAQTPSPTGLGNPIRVALADVDRDGLLDASVLDDSGFPEIIVLRGTGAGFDDASPYSKLLVPVGTPHDLAVGDVAENGRPDFVVPEISDPDAYVTVVANTSGPDCLRTSFGDAPRAFPAGDGPWAVAVADYDEDGIDDLVVAQENVAGLAFLKGNGNGYDAPVDPVFPPGTVDIRARGVATADFDFDGHADVVAALGNGATGRLQVFLGDGTGVLNAGAVLADGPDMSAVVVGDFDGDGGPDVAAVSRSAPGELHVFLGLGGGTFSPITPLTLGGLPWALAAEQINSAEDGHLDLAVADYSSNLVFILTGNGDGTFALESPVTVGAAPWSVALGRVDADVDGYTDLVTANFTGADVSIASGDGNGSFGASESWTPPTRPIAVSVLDATNDGTPDVLVAVANHTLTVLEGPYTSPSFASESILAVRNRPSQMVPVDADADGIKDLVIPCKDSDDVVVLLARPPGFLQAMTVAIGDTPLDAVSGDFDRDGDIDLAVVNSGVGATSNSLLILENDGTGALAALPRLTIGGSPVAVVTADFDLDSDLDLAVSLAGSNEVLVLEGNGSLVFAPATLPRSLTLGQPDGLVAADFDRDGDPDLAVLSRSEGKLYVFDNRRGFVFGPDLPTVFPTYDVGVTPTAIAAADFDRNGTLDLAVANDGSNDVTVLLGNSNLTFVVAQTLNVTPDTSPVSVTTGDFDSDGDADLAVVASGGQRLLLLRNTAGSFPTPPTRIEDIQREATFLTTSDLNRDGKADLALAASGLKALRGTGSGLTFAASEDFVAGITPVAAVVADFDRDGLLDVAVVNRDSDTVSVLYGTACVRRRLVASLSPAGCIAGPGPFGVHAIVDVQDDGGNMLDCAGGTMKATLAAGAGGSLGGTKDLVFTGGQADFDDLTIDPGGPRYRLRFELDGVPSVTPILSRSFSLEPLITIVGPTSVCPATSETYTVSEALDTYAWTLTPSGLGYPQFNPSAVLNHAALTPETLYTLDLQGHVDGCAPADSLDVYVGNLNSVSLSVDGPVMVCVDCLGGKVTASDLGGGAAVSRQWGYRLTSGSTVTNISGETDQSYVIKGTDFPGPGDYYLVEITTPTCGTPVISDELMVTVTAIVPSGEAQSLGVTSTGLGAGLGQNRVQWVNTTAPNRILIRWNKAPNTVSDCVSPLSRQDAFQGEWEDTAPSASAKAEWIHGGLDLDTTYCYTVFVEDSLIEAPGRVVKGRPLDTSSGPVVWAYTTGATAVVPPVITANGIMAMSNDRTVHSLERGKNGGKWPAAWMPATLAGVAHARSPVVPFVVPVNGHSALLLVGDDTGTVSAINADTGQTVWATPTGSDSITGAPGGTFVQYGGTFDYILSGSRAAPPPPDVPVAASSFFAFDVATGAPVGTPFTGAGTLGPVSGSPSIDNGNDLVFVASRSFGGGDTLWFLQLGAAPTFTSIWSDNLGEFDTSPVYRNGRVYVGNNAGEVYFVDVATQTPSPAFTDNIDGAVKGFLFPDRRNSNLYFSSNNYVWSVRDTGTDIQENWKWQGDGTVKPSIVLHWPDTDYLYVGGEGGWLYELDISGAPSDTCPSTTCKRIQLGDGGDRLGAPSLDIGVDVPDVSAGKKLLHVGSESGVLYAVEVPLP